MKKIHCKSCLSYKLPENMTTYCGRLVCLACRDRIAAFFKAEQEEKAKDQKTDNTPE